MDRSMVQHPVWMVPAPFSAMGYVKNGRYFAWDEASEDEKLQKKRKNNEEVYQTESSSDATSSGSYKVVSDMEGRDLKCNEELFVDYGKNMSSASEM